jgi:hypothetical protein
MAGDDLKLETRFSGSRGAFPYVVVALAVLGILGIVVVTTTDVAARLLPMDENYRNVLVPTVADGSLPLSLKTLHHVEDKKARTLTLDGTVTNRTDAPIKGLLAVIQVKDRFTIVAQTVDVPVEPAELVSQGAGKFQTVITWGDNGMGGFDIQFKLSPDGPFVPHVDERPAEPTSEPVPSIKINK